MSTDATGRIVRHVKPIAGFDVVIESDSFKVCIREVLRNGKHCWGVEIPADATIRLTPSPPKS